MTTNDIDFYDNLKKESSNFADCLDFDKFEKSVAEMAFYAGGRYVWKTECQKEELEEQEKCYYAVVTFQTAMGFARKSYTMSTTDKTFPLMPILRHAVKDNPNGIVDTFMVENAIEISHEQMVEHAKYCGTFKEEKV